MTNNIRPFRDADGNPISSDLQYPRGTTVQVALSTTTALSTAVTLGTQFVEVIASVFAFVKVGSSTGTAALTDQPIPPNTRTLIPMRGSRYIAGICGTVAGSTAGTLYATEIGAA